MNDVSYKMTPLGGLPIDWSTKNIESICEILDSKRVPLNKQQREKMQGEIPYYGANGVLDYIDDYLFNEPLILMAEDGGYFSEYNTRPIAYKVKDKSWVNNHAHVLKPLENEVFDWIYYNLVHKNILPFINGGTRAKLNQKDLRRLPIAYPPYKEQQKISAILSSVDEAIEKTEQIIEQTGTVKKGLMQQLLTKGIGHTEFKKSKVGEIPNSWKIVKQGDVAQFYNGRAFKQKEFVEEGTPVVRIQNLTGGTNYVYSNLQLDDNKYIENDDLIYAWSATFGPYIWKGSKSIYHYHIWKIVCSNEILKKYFYYKLHSLSSESTNQKNGAVFAHLTKSFMESYEIALPPLEEQKKIVRVLESIDNKKDNELDKLKTLTSLKQGLMQQLLTGKVRVKINDNEEVPS